LPLNFNRGQAGSLRYQCIRNYFHYWTAGILPAPRYKFSGTFYKNTGLLNFRINFLFVLPLNFNRGQAGSLRSQCIRNFFHYWTAGILPAPRYKFSGTFYKNTGSLNFRINFLFFIATELQQGAGWKPAVPVYKEFFSLLDRRHLAFPPV
jgi:hypothetical protein